MYIWHLLSMNGHLAHLLLFIFEVIVGLAGSHKYKFGGCRNSPCLGSTTFLQDESSPNDRKAVVYWQK